MNIDYTNHPSLEQKVKDAEAILKKAHIKHEGKLFINFSGGKDSTILRHISLNIFPDLPVVFSNTTNEMAEIIKYVKTFPNVITVKPKMSFFQVIEKHGFPLVSKEVSQKVSELKHTNGAVTRNTRFQGDKKGNGKTPNKWRFLAEKDFDVTHKCCKILKKDPLDKWAKEKQLKPIIGLMADESKLRQQLALFGDENSDKIYPFLRTGWSEQDIWDYAELHNIRFAECYYEQTINGIIVPPKNRTGCEFCAFGITLEKNDRFERSKIVSPKRFEKAMKVENNGVTFKEAIDLVKNNIHKPIMDLYGIKLKDEIKHPTKKITSFNTDITTSNKKCPHCESKNFSKNFGYQMNYFDSPSNDGDIRNVYLKGHGYDCNSCSLPFHDDLHMFNPKLGVTNRLIEYVHQKVDFSSLEKIFESYYSEISTSTHLSFEQTYDILLLNEEATNTLEKEQFVI